VVIDNEAGLENLSRRIVASVDALVLVSDASQAGLATVKRLYELAREMKISYKKLTIVVNRLRTPELPDAAQKLRAEVQADFLIGLPHDEEIAALSEQGQSMSSLAAGNPTAKIIGGLIASLC
jgi:CO dehydrogenase maturation factor